MELIVVKPFMAFGQRQEAGQVIDLPVAEAAYVVGLQLATRVEPKPAEEAAPPKKPATAKKAK
jgi:hypothetical protein